MWLLMQRKAKEKKKVTVGKVVTKIKKRWWENLHVDIWDFFFLFPPLLVGLGASEWNFAAQPSSGPPLVVFVGKC